MTSARVAGLHPLTRPSLWPGCIAIRHVCLFVCWLVCSLMCSLLCSFISSHPATGCIGGGRECWSGGFARAWRWWRPTSLKLFSVGVKANSQSFVFVYYWFFLFSTYSISTHARDQKMSKFRCDFWQLSTLIVNISGTDRHVESRKKLINYNPYTMLNEKNRWTLTHKQKSSRGAYWPTQVDIFRETTFRILGGVAPSNFPRAS